MAKLHFNSVLPTFTRTRRAIADTSPTLSINDNLVVFTSITAARTVTLPVATGNAGRVITIKDESGSASGVNTISAVGTVDGAANPVLINAAFGFVTLETNGTNWFKIG